MKHVCMMLVVSMHFNVDNVCMWFHVTCDEWNDKKMKILQSRNGKSTLMENLKCIVNINTYIYLISL